MSIQTDIQRKKLMHLENTFVMLFVCYNTETLGKLVKTVHVLHSRQSSYKSLFACKTSVAYEFYLQMHGAWGIQCYAINSMLYLRTVKDKCTKIYNEFISQLHIYTKAVRILAKVICQFCLQHH